LGIIFIVIFISPVLIASIFCRSPPRAIVLRRFFDALRARAMLAEDRNALAAKPLCSSSFSLRLFE
jgi:hypothetical protein